MSLLFLDTYDLAVMSGGDGNGHFPCEGLYEILRILKSGDHIQKHKIRYFDICIVIYLYHAAFFFLSFCCC